MYGDMGPIVLSKDFISNIGHRSAATEEKEQCDFFSSCYLNELTLILKPLVLMLSLSYFCHGALLFFY
uniref:Uncharacterized protein n=1 Tax=Arundo donax TaxID=35708 RepID=A0A0A9AMA5_ARUDO